ncbi:MAG: efflux RND transporter periplasmic adaptor subunit [Parabacteroides sp.]
MKGVKSVNLNPLLWSAGCCLVLLGLGVSCSEPKTQVTEEDTVETVQPEAVNHVTIQELQPTEFHHELISNGKLSARRRADLHFETAETIANIYVKNGDRVRAGQKLASLATFRLTHQVEQAQVALEQARLELQDVMIGQGYALADSAKVPAETMRLIRVRSGYDQALSAYQLAEYELERATLTAPFDGVVANLTAKAYNTASTTDLFCTLIDPQSLEAVFSVMENELPLVKPGERVEIRPFAAEVESSGQITEINPVVDENGMVQLKAQVSAKAGLFEGMNVRVSVKRSLGKQLVVPKSAVVLRSGKQVVFTLDDHKAMWNYVRTGLENADSYTIEEGLEAGMQVITSGNINLAHESPVEYD